METKAERQSHVAWCKRHHASIKIGGVWGVPRSGLLFKKTAAGFDLENVMPYSPAMEQAFQAFGADVPGTAEELLEYQLNDFACVQRHNKEAGLEVTDSKSLLNKLADVLIYGVRERKSE
jgi:hypothetical protein